jgi:hypothetical protein
MSFSIIVIPLDLYFFHLENPSETNSGDSESEQIAETRCQPAAEKKGKKKDRKTEGHKDRLKDRKERYM